MDYTSLRHIIRGDLWDQWSTLELDQKLGLPVPALQKPYPAESALIELVAPASFTIGSMPLL